MTRQERIAFHKSMGWETAKLEAMTDAQYESEMDFQEEKALRSGSEHRRMTGHTDNGGW